MAGRGEGGRERSQLGDNDCGHLFCDYYLPKLGTQILRIAIRVKHRLLPLLLGLMMIILEVDNTRFNEFLISLEEKNPPHC